MNNIKIYNPTDELLLEIPVDDNSYRLCEIMGDNRLELRFSLPEFVPIIEGAYCDFKEERYWMPRAVDYVKEHSQKFNYTLSLEGSVSFLKATKFKFFDYLNEGNTVKPTSSFRLKFPITASPRMIADLIVANMKIKYPQYPWMVGDCIESDPITLDFNHDFCFDVLAKTAEGFNTEWELDKYTLNFCKVEKMKDTPVDLSYGYNNGILGGIRRIQYDNARIINRVYIEGGERNIDRSTYGNDTLLLPKNKQITYEGIDYTTDASGSYLERVTPIAGEEDSLDVSKFYPKRIGTVSAVKVINDAEGLYNIIDSSIPADLNYSKMIIAGETMTLIFQAGQLAGKEFDVKYIHAKRTFELVPIDDNGLIYPQGNIIPAVGDTYAVFHMRMPAGYITSAETEALNETVQYLWENEQPQYSYRWSLDGIYAKRNWGEISGFLNIGYFVRFSDPQFLPDAVDIRIVAVKELVNDAQSPEITIANNVSSRTLGSVISEIPTQEQAVDRKDKEVLNYAKRRYRDAAETIKLLENSLLEFSEGINPITLNTMFALIGDEKLQYEFVNSRTNPQVISSGISYNQTSKVLTCPARIIQHMTLGEKKLSSTHALSEYLFWNVKAYISDVLTETGTPYFLYIKASKTNFSDAVYLLSKNAIEMESVAGYYHFLVATLNSEQDSYRSYTEWYGYTEISPRRMITNLIQSADGRTYFDLANNRLQISNSGSNVVSPSGDTSVIEVDRGGYNRTKTYYVGDKVWYSGIAYVCISNSTAANTPDKDSSKWKPYSQEVNIGGRNLIFNTNQGTTWWYRLIQNGTVTISEAQELGVRACKFTTSAVSTGYHVLYHGISRSLIKNNSQYMLSMDIYCEFDTTMQLVLRAPNGLNQLTPYYNKAITKGTWVRVEQIITTNNNTATDQVLYITGFNKVGSVTFANLQLEEGNKATAWSPAPEDVQKGIDEAKSQASDAQTSATQAQSNVNSLNTYVDGAFSDGIITQAEARAIETHLKNVNDTMAQLESTYNKLYVNSYLEGTAKTSLLNAKVNLFGARDALVKAINDAIADGKTTTSEKNNVNVKYDLFNDAIRSFNTAVEDANKSIQNKLDSLSTDKVNNLQIGGRNLIFNTNQGTTWWYRLIQNGTVTISEAQELGVRACKFTTSAVSTGYHVLYHGISRSLIKNNSQYILSMDVYCEYDTTAEFRLIAVNGLNQLAYIGTKWIPANTWIHVELSAITNSSKATDQVLYITGFNKVGSVTFANLQLEEGNKATAWSPAPEDVQAQITALDYIKEAIGKGETSIQGGLVLTTMIQLLNLQRNVKAGINGNISRADDVALWLGGTLQQAIDNLAAVVFRADGSAMFGKGAIRFNADGSGSLANQNIQFDSTGNLQVTGKYRSKTMGNRFEIDPENESLYGYNIRNQQSFRLWFSSNLTQMEFQNGNYKTRIAPNIVETTALSLNWDMLTDFDPKIRGRVWRSGNSLMISAG